MFPGACAENCSHLVTSVATSAPSRAAVRTCCGVGPLLSCCQAVILSGCDKTQYWTPGPRHLHTLQVTIDINLQLGITGGGGEGPHRKYIICFNTPLCVVAAGVRWLVQASIDRRLPRCQPSSCFLTPAGPDVFLPIPQQPGPCHTVIAYCHTVTLSHCHTVTLSHCHTRVTRLGHQMELLRLVLVCGG